MDVPGFALITGGASGIGLACAKTFAQEGSAGIALLDINGDTLAAAKQTIFESLRPKNGAGQGDGEKKLSGTGSETARHCVAQVATHLASPLRIETFVIDVTNEAEVERVVSEVAQQFGRIDYVVNAAGIAIKHIGGAAFAKTDDWQRVLDINLTGTFFVLRAATKIMLEQTSILSSQDGRALQRGSIVNFSSIQGLVGITLSAAYTASKHAIIGLTKSASEDYAGQGLRINAVAPGYTETPLTTRNPDVFKAMQERVNSAVPMARMGKPSEIADAVVWLSGGRSSFVTGSTLVVDGGYTER